MHRVDPFHHQSSVGQAHASKQKHPSLTHLFPQVFEYPSGSTTHTVQESSATFSLTPFLRKRAIGDEFLVTTASGSEHVLGVVKLTNGHVVVVWGYNYVTLRLQRIDPIAQQMVGTELVISLETSRNPGPDLYRKISVAALPEGGFVLSLPDGLLFYTNNMEQVGADSFDWFLDNADLSTPQLTPLLNNKLAFTYSGIKATTKATLVRIYSSEKESLSNFNIYSQRSAPLIYHSKVLPDGRVIVLGKMGGLVLEVYSVENAVIKNRFLVTNRYEHYRFVSVTSLPNGRFLVLYEGSSAPMSYNLHFHIFNSNNEVVVDMQQVNMIFGGEYPYPYAIAYPDGRFTIMWASTDLNGYGILSQDYLPNGEANGEPRRVNVNMSGDQTSPVGISLDSQHVFYAWNSMFSTGTNIMGRVLPQISIPTTTTSSSTTTTTSSSTTTTTSSSTKSITTASHTSQSNLHTDTTQSATKEALTFPVSSTTEVATSISNLVTSRRSFTTTTAVSVTTRIFAPIFTTTGALTTLTRQTSPDEPLNPLVPVVAVLASLCLLVTLVALAALARLRWKNKGDGVELGRLSDRSHRTSSSGTSRGTRSTRSDHTRASRQHRRRNEIYAGFPPLPSTISSSSTLRSIYPDDSQASVSGNERIYTMVPPMHKD